MLLTEDRLWLSKIFYLMHRAMIVQTPCVFCQSVDFLILKTQRAFHLIYLYCFRDVLTLAVDIRHPESSLAMSRESKVSSFQSNRSLSRPLLFDPAEHDIVSLPSVMLQGLF